MKMYRAEIGGRVVAFSDATPIIVTTDPRREVEIGAPAVVMLGGVAVATKRGVDEVLAEILAAIERGPAALGLDGKVAP